MKKIFNFTIQYLSALLLIVGIAFAFTACSDDDSQSGAPVVEKVSSTYDAVSFKWAAVSNATEYVYRLVCDNDGKEVEKGTTANTSIDFAGLTPVKTYYLYVSAKVGGGQTVEGRAAAATGFKLSQPSASMKVRMTDDAVSKRKTWLSWSTTAAEKYAYSLDGATEVVTDKAGLDLPDDFAVEEHTIAIRAIIADPLFQGSDVNIYTFTPSGSKKTGFLNSRVLNVQQLPLEIEYWRFVDGTKFADQNKYRIDSKEPIFGKVFSSYPEFKKDDKTYALIPLGDGISEVKKEDKVIGYDFGIFKEMPIMVTAITIDSGLGTLSVTYTYDVDRKKSETIKVALSVKVKEKNEL